MVPATGLVVVARLLTVVVEPSVSVGVVLVSVLIGGVVPAVVAVKRVLGVTVVLVVALILDGL